MCHAHADSAPINRVTCASEPQLAAFRTTQNASDRTSDSVSAEVASCGASPQRSRFVTHHERVVIAWEHDKSGSVVTVGLQQVLHAQTKRMQRVGQRVGGRQKRFARRLPPQQAEKKNCFAHTHIYKRLPWVQGVSKFYTLYEGMYITET